MHLTLLRCGALPLLLWSLGGSLHAAGACDNITVERARFALAIADREPVGEPPVAVPQRYDNLFFFTELHGAAGETLIHRWLLDGAIQAEIRLQVGGNRWRTWSRKNIAGAHQGHWTVELVSGQGCTLGRYSLSADTPLPVLEEARALLEKGDSTGARLLVKAQLDNHLPWRQQLEDFLDIDVALAQVRDLMTERQLYMADARLTAVEQHPRITPAAARSAHVLRDALARQRESLRSETALALRALASTLTATLAGGTCPDDEASLQQLLETSEQAAHWLVNEWSRDGREISVSLVDARTGFLHGMTFLCAPPLGS